MENTNKNTSMTREDLKKQIYTKDGTVKTPDGREFGNLTSALKAYDLHINTFYERLDKGCSIREAFVGPDYKCGLKFDNDGKVRDYNKKPFNSLVEMCDYHKADIKWFQKLYEVTQDLELSLKQSPEHKSEMFILEYKMKNEERLKKEKLLEEKRKKEEEDKSIMRTRVNKARKVLQKYCEFHLNSYKSCTYNRAIQIKRLAEFLSTYSTLTYDENRLYKKVLIALDAGTTNHLRTPDPNQALVDSILLDFKYNPKAKAEKKDSGKKSESVKSSVKATSSNKDDANTTTNSLSDSKELKDVKNIKEIKKKKDVDSLSPEEIKRQEEIREKRAMAGRMSAAKRKEKKLLASDKGLFIVETEKPKMSYSEAEEESIRILKEYLGELTAF